MEQAQNFVDKYYIMDPNEDGLLFDGRDLRNGMLVLVEDPTRRASTIIGSTPMSTERYGQAMKWNRWCVVSNLLQEDETVHFLGSYEDGTIMKFSVDVRLGWLVKLKPRDPNTPLPRPYFDPLTSPEWPPANDNRPNTIADTKVFDRPHH